MVEIKLLCFMWLSAFCNCVQRGFPKFASFQAIFSVSFEWMHFQLDYPMSRSMYPALRGRNFVYCSLILWSCLMLCSATADLPVCATLIRLLCSLILIWIDRPFCTI